MCMFWQLQIFGDEMQHISNTVNAVDCYAVMDQAFVTLATNDSYALGALVLGNSLKVVGTTRSLAVMITSDVSDSLR